MPRAHAIELGLNARFIFLAGRSELRAKFRFDERELRRGQPRRGVGDPPAKPGPPILAQGEIELENVDTECAGLIAALDRYGQCPNLEDGDRQWVRSAIEAAENSFAAGKKANPDEPSQHAIVGVCLELRRE